MPEKAVGNVQALAAMLAIAPLLQGAQYLIVTEAPRGSFSCGAPADGSQGTVRGRPTHALVRDNAQSPL
jgi:hypothetical protein